MKLSRSNLAVRSYGPDTDFQYMCIVTLTLEVWPCVKVMTHTLASWTIVWNIIQIQLGNEELWPGYEFPVCVHCDLDLGDMTLGQGHDTPLRHGQQLCEILSRSNLAVRSYGPDTDIQYVCTVTLTLEIWPWVKVMTHPWVMDNNCVKYYPDPTWQWGVMARIRISSMCALWPWPWRYDFGSRSWHTLASWTTIVWNIIQIQLGSEELWPGHGYPVCVHCDLDLGDMTLGQGHDTPLGHGQQLCEILSRSNLAVRSYGPDTNFQYVCTVTLTLEIWPWVKVMTHPWDMDNNCVKLYPDRTREYRVMARTRCEQTDGRTDRQSDSYMYIPPKLCLRGGGGGGGDKKLQKTQLYKVFLKVTQLGKGLYMGMFKLETTSKISVIISENITEIDAVLCAQHPTVWKCLIFYIRIKILEWKLTTTTLYELSNGS